jgi:HlyD family secretion protein
VQASCSMAGLFLAMAYLSGCGHAPAGENGNPAGGLPPARVTVQNPQRKTLQRTIELPGQIVAYEEAPLMAKVTGYVSEVRVDIGSRVQGPRAVAGDVPAAAGDELIVIDVPELVQEGKQREADVVKAKAAVAQAKAAIDVAKALRKSADADVAEAESAVRGSEALVAKWKSESERVTQLASRGAVTQQVSNEASSQLLVSEAAVQQSQAKIRSAEARVTEAEAGIAKAEADAAAAEAEVQVTEAEVERVKSLLSFRTLHAPFDGVVTSRRVHPGHLIRATSSEPLMTVSRIDRLRVRVDVPESDALLVRTGNKATLKFPSLPGQSVEAKVDRSSESLDRGSRTLAIEIDVDNSEGLLKPGTYAQAVIDVANRENVLAVPRSAILTQDKETYVLLVDAGGKVVVQPVLVGIQAGADVEILSGLTGTERMIQANVGGFRAGQIVQAEPAGAAGAASK